MRIAICTDTFLPQVNGVTNTLDKLLNYLEKEGHEYKVFAPEDEKEYNYHNVKRFKSVKFLLYPECRFSLPNYFKLNEYLDIFKPELIHLVTPFNIGIGGLRYALRNNIPLVSSYHTHFTRYLSYYNLTFLENLIWKYFKWFHSFCSVNYCPSRETMLELKKQDIKNMELWDRGIDTDFFKPENRSSFLRNTYGINNKIVMLFVGRFAAEKDIEVLVNAFNILNKKYKDKIHLLLTGDGPLYSKLEKEVPDNVTFTGYKKGADLAEIYASADIFTFPSSTETYGNVVLEAMASGLPAVCADRGGVLENCINGKNSVIFRHNDSKDMALKISTLVENENFRLQMGLEGRKHTLEKSWDKVLERLVNSYINVINNTYHIKSA